MLKGFKHGYHNLFTFTHEKALERFVQILSNKGVAKVHMFTFDIEPNVKFESLYFSELTLAILPQNIIGANIDTEVSNKAFNYNQQQFRTSNVFQIFDENNCERIKHNDYVIADYYKNRNLIIMYYNPFPDPPRIRKFQNAIDLLFNNLRGIEIVDNSKYLSEAQKKRNYALFSKNLSSQYSRFNANINDALRNIESHGKSIIIAEKVIQESNAAKSGIEKLLENFDTEFEAKIEDLSTLPFLKSVKVSNDGIILDYGEVEIEYGKKKYYIGHINVVLKYDSIVFKNLNNKADGYPHPHVSSGGSACFGSYTKDVSRMLGQLEFRKLAILLRQMLHSYNPRSPIHRIDAWKSKILSENDPKKKLAKKTKAKEAAENVSNTIRDILNSDEYKRGINLTREEFSLLNATQRAAYISNRSRRNLR